MLQINTGKLFTAPVVRENTLRGVLYTNLVLDGPHSGKLFGTLTPTSELGGSPKTLIYDFVERIEGEIVPGTLVSHGADPYLADMSAVVGFTLNCICSPDIDLVRRLTRGERGLATGAVASSLVKRVYDKEIWCQPNEGTQLTQFLDELLGLPRKDYLAVMRSIRTYVTGMHRVADDLELGYTLLVASVESLAQQFDGHKAVWSSLDENKRGAFDTALKGAPSDVVGRVHEAVLSAEHVALRRRFQGFVEAHAGTSYFHGSQLQTNTPLTPSELPEVLSSAYEVRSKHVHQLKKLPDMLKVGHINADTIIDGRRKYLTLQGLARLMQHVIVSYVKSRPKVQAEKYNYSHERAGIVQARLDPSMWVSRADGDISTSGRDRLEGFVEQLAAAELKTPHAVVNDLRLLLSKFLEQAPQMKMALRLPYSALLRIFNWIAGEKSVSTSAAIELLIQQDLGRPSSPSLLVHAYCELECPWPIDVHQEEFRLYLSLRGAKSGIRFPRLLETAIRLQIAERHRAAGKLDAYAKALEDAVNNYPESEPLRLLVEKRDEGHALSWRHLLPESGAANC